MEQNFIRDLRYD